jgi:GNAT superfamily N-acetyltransferase
VSLRLTTLRGPEILPCIPGLARLRIGIFRDFPYLYDGNLAYETDYLASYARSSRAAVIAVEDLTLPEADRLVGAATALPLSDEPEAFTAPVTAAGIDVASVCYFGESLLRKDYRGRGLGHRFFDAREAHARSLGLALAMFCAVIRPADHPRTPPSYRPLDAFWHRRGYVPVAATARLSWKDIDGLEETAKPLRFWAKDLAAVG